MPLVSTIDIERASKSALVAYGAKDWIAVSVARAIADAESFGNVICGLYYLESYCRQLVTGRVDGTVDPQVSASRPGVRRPLRGVHPAAGGGVLRFAW